MRGQAADAITDLLSIASGLGETGGRGIHKNFLTAPRQETPGPAA